MSSSPRPVQSGDTSEWNKHSTTIKSQTSVDAKLDAEFAETGVAFDYLQTTVVAHKASSSSHHTPVMSEEVATYLQHFQKGRLVQPFGCLVAVDERTFGVIAFSENAPEMLTSLGPRAVPALGNDDPVLDISANLSSLFAPPDAARLHKASGFPDLPQLNPIQVRGRNTGEPFYAIFHRVTGCLIVDFEPVKLGDDAPMRNIASGSLQSYKLAAKAIAKLQALPGGSMKRLCGTVVEQVFELTGYDRVMAYKFHDDHHREVFAERSKPGLEPYLGLHYPATDVPQARF